MASGEVNNVGGRDSMIESPFWKRNSNNLLHSLKSQTLPRPNRKIPTECGSGSNSNASI